MIPTFESCLVCDLIREELYGKLAILGYFGICPNVDVRVKALEQPTVLTFLIAGGKGSGEFFGNVVVFDEGSQQPIASGVSTTFLANPIGATYIGTLLVLTFGHPGLFSVRLIVEQSELFRAFFLVSQGSSPST